MKKTLVFLMAFAMLLTTCLTGCQMFGKKDEASSENTDTTAISPSGDDTASQNEVLDIPDDLDYGDEEFVILTYNSNVKEFGDTAATDVISQTQVERDAKVEDALGVSFNIKTMNGQWVDRLTYADTVHQNIFGGSKSWDLIGAYSFVPPNLSMRGDLVDLRATKYLNFSKAWWPQFMVDVTTVNDKTFFISGDVSINTLYEMIPVFFNISLVQAHGFDVSELYNMVREGRWTMENFFTMIQDASVQSGDMEWNQDDLYAFSVLDNTCFDAFYYATGLSAFKENSDGSLSVSDRDFGGNQILDIFEMACDAIDTYHSLGYNTAQPLEANLALFATYKLYNMRLEKNPNQYGVLPWPKYEEGTDTNYQTLLGSPHTQYCIPKDVDDSDRSSAVLEMLAYQSYVDVTPVVFEETMKVRYSHDENASQMYDIIRDGLTTDLGILYYDAFVEINSGDVASIFRNMIINPTKRTTSWTTNYEQYYQSALVDVQNQLNGIYG